MTDYALVDNNLAKSQLSIGESSNLAQLALTYTYNFHDKKYNDYVCILSCLAQIAIDNAKRKYDIDINEEIKRIKNDMDIKENGYPKFWLNIKENFNKDKINNKLVCPMNCLIDLNIPKSRDKLSTLPIEYFINKYELKEGRRKSKKVEALIETYSLKLYNKKDTNEDYLLLRNDFDDMIQQIQSMYLSKEYLGLMSWLINRAFLSKKENGYTKHNIKTKIDKNKSLLLKTLFQVNKDNLIQIFSKNL